MEIPFLHRLALLITTLAIILSAVSGIFRRVREADTTRYERIAENMLHQSVISACEQPPFLPEIVRMPGYPAFLAGVKAIAGEGDYKIIFAQSLLHGLTTLALFWLAFALFGSMRLSLFTQLAWAFYPYAFLYATTLMSETLSAAALTLGLTGLVVYWRTGMRRFLMLSCVGFIAGAYTRPNLWIVPPFLFFLALCFKSIRNQFTLRPLGVICLVVGLSLAPWVARNYLTFGKILIGSENYLGNNLCQSSVQFRFSLAEIASYCGETTENSKNWLNECDWRRNLAQDEEFKERAFVQLREHFVSFSLYSLLRPFRIWVSYNLDNRAPTAGVRTVETIAGAITLAGFPFFICGLYLLVKRAEHGWVLAATCVAISATHLVVVAMGRYSMSVRPMYVLAVVYALFESSKILHRTGPERNSRSMAT